MSQKQVPKHWVMRGEQFVSCVEEVHNRSLAVTKWTRNLKVS